MSIHETALCPPKMYQPVHMTRAPYEEAMRLPGGWTNQVPEAYATSDRGYDENQDSIDSWALETFGLQDLPTLLTRFLEEVEELKDAVASPLDTDEDRAKVGKELADIYIVAVQMASRVDVDLAGCVDHKMAINRIRKWKKDKDGLWRHKK